MYRHILIPTDGSRLAAKGIKAGLRLAKALGARVTGVHVVPRNPPPVYAVEGVVFVPELTPAVFAQTVKKEAAKILSVLAGQARAARARQPRRPDPRKPGDARARALQTPRPRSAVKATCRRVFSAPLLRCDGVRRTH